jgi:hypothetical protein
MIHEGQFQGNENSILSKIKRNIIGYQVKKFFYNIGGEDFTLDEIKHGMIRRNKKKPGDWNPILQPENSKLQILSNAIENDPRINFVCLEFPELVEHTHAFGQGDKTNLNDDLE